MAYTSDSAGKILFFAYSYIFSGLVELLYVGGGYAWEPQIFKIRLNLRTFQAQQGQYEAIIKTKWPDKSTP